MISRRTLLGAGAGSVVGAAAGRATEKERRLLYVAEPGIRNYVELGGVGVVVFDIDAGHRFVKRIPTPSVGSGAAAENVKGICACAKAGRLYVSTIKRLLALDLLTDKLLWDRAYEGGCDRMSITPDGKTIYLPSLEGPHWFALDAASGEPVKKIVLNSGAHNTLCSLDGKHVYLAGLKSPLLRVVSTRTHEVEREVGPFGNVIRPFTVNGRGTLAYVNVNDLLGFEIGDLTTGKVLHRVEVRGYRQGPVKRHGCPSHGVGLTPDEKQVWLCDGHNEAIHVFDNTVKPPKQVASLKLRDQPGWVTFSLDGRCAYPSTGEVIDISTRRIVTALQDETSQPVHSEKLVEIHFRNGKPLRNGDQFGIGRRRKVGRQLQ